MCAKELNISIVLLSQLSRAVEVRSSNKIPQLSDIRDSGSIEQIADKVWFVYRPEYYLIDELNDDDFTSTDCVLMLIVAKNRSGKLGTSYFKRNPQFTNFTSFKFPMESINFSQSRITELKNTSEKNIDEECPF